MPQRLYDSRTAGAPVRAGADTLVQVAGRAGVPASGVRAVALNVTVTGVERGMDLQVYPGGALPTRRTSNLNAVPGQTVANAVTTALGEGGDVALSVSHGSASVIVDVLGWYDEDGSGAGYTAVSPARRLDTRETVPVRAGSERVVRLFDVTPSGLTAAVVSLTALGADGPLDLAAYAPGARPLERTSTLNLRPGETLANLATVPVDALGRIALSASAGQVHVIVDVLGYHATGSGGSLTALVPDRLLDTREQRAPVPAGADRRVRVLGVGGVPADGVRAVLLNLTAVNATGPADVQVYATGDRPPQRTSNLHARPPRAVPVLVLAPVGADGTVSVSVSQGESHVLVDVLGWVGG